MKKRQFCFNCGADLGIYDSWGSYRESCGERECEREAHIAESMERQEAHDQLDRDRGWDY